MAENAELREALLPFLPYARCEEIEVKGSFVPGTPREEMNKSLRDSYGNDFNFFKKIGRRMLAEMGG